MDSVTVSASDGTADGPLVSEDMEGICVMPDISAIKTEQSVGASPDDPGTQNVAMGIKFILPNRFDMNVCSRFVKSLNEEDSKNIQDQVNSDLEVASVLFKGNFNFKGYYVFMSEAVNNGSLLVGLQLVAVFILDESISHLIYKMLKHVYHLFT